MAIPPAEALEDVIGRVIPFNQRPQGFVFPKDTVAHGRQGVRPISLGDPAANTEYPTLTLPGGSKWRLAGFAGTLVTDAGAANRAFHIDARTPDGSVISAGVAVAAQTASLTSVYRGVKGVAPAAAGLVLIPVVLTDTLLDGGWQLVFVTENKQATDNWGVGTVTLEEIPIVQGVS